MNDRQRTKNTSSPAIPSPWPRKKPMIPSSLPPPSPHLPSLLPDPYANSKQTTYPVKTSTNPSSRSTFYLLALALALAPAAHAGITLGADDLFTPPATNPDGNLTISGGLGVANGLDVGVSAANANRYAIQVDFYNTGSLPKTASFDITDSASSFLWRDNLVGTPRSKMQLGTTNILTLYNNVGTATGISLNPNTGQIHLTGTNSGIYVSGSPVMTVDSSGNLSFPGTGNWSISGNLVVAKDSTINGVKIGKGAGYNNASNVALGPNTLNSATAGYSNTALGSDALRYTTSGSDNTAVGASALTSNGSGYYNSAVGSTALRFNTSGNNNSALGYESLKANTSGTHNTAMGSRALTSNTSGTQNIAVGSFSLNSTTAGANTALGYNSGVNNTSGKSNLFLGWEAGRFQANGTTSLTDPDYSTYIGAGARGKDNADSNSIVIGYHAIGEGANTTVIGNTSTTSARIFGNLVTGSITSGGNSVLTTDDSNAFLDQVSNDFIAKGDIGIYDEGALALRTCSAQGPLAVAMGYETHAYGIASTSMGADTRAEEDFSTVMGILNDPQLNSLFEIGNGDWQYDPVTGEALDVRSNALTVNINGQTTLTNKAWKADPVVSPTPENSNGQALVVEGHTVLEGNTVLQGDTVLNGKVIISVPQGDISMGIYE